jgi:SAM-dependent methyltransferase
MNDKNYSSHGSITLESMNQAKWYNKWVFKKFENYLGGDILEVGCGIGSFTSELLKFGKVWAIDIDRNFINYSRAKDQNLHIGLGDVEKRKYFFGDRKFDSVVCLNVLEHIEGDEKALVNLHSLLKNDGNLIIIVPINQFLYGGIDKAIGHFRRYEGEEFIKKMNNLGFEIRYQRKLNFLGSIGWFVAGRILIQSTISEENIKLFNILAPIFLKFENYFEPPLGTSLLLIATKKQNGKSKN